VTHSQFTELKQFRHARGVPDHMRRRPRSVVAAAVAAVLGGVVAFTPAVRADSAEDLARRLAALRAEVEELSEELTVAKTETRNQIQSLARQKSDLQMELEREQLRLAKLRDALEDKRETIVETSSEGEDLEPVFESALAAMRGYVSTSLPFRRDERLAELDKIQDQLETGLLTYPRALARLWSFIEDELRMTRENAMFQQTVVLGDQEHLADVVRVGMVMLFFQTDDGRVGYTRKTPEGWVFAQELDSDRRKQIRNLFDSFKKQIRVGLFRLPNALPLETR
jgi:hypothetical protein